MFLPIVESIYWKMQCMIITNSFVVRYCVIGARNSLYCVNMYEMTCCSLHYLPVYYVSEGWSVVSTVPMGILMKSTNSFTLWRALASWLKAVTSPTTASVAAHGHVDALRPRAQRKWDRGESARGATGSTNPHIQPIRTCTRPTVALFQP